MQTEIPAELLGIQYPIIQVVWPGWGASSCGSCIRGRRPGTDRAGKRTGGMGGSRSMPQKI